MSESTSKVRSTKLTFKGDKKGKKRKRKDKDVGGRDSGGEGSDAEGADPQGAFEVWDVGTWVRRPWQADANFLVVRHSLFIYRTCVVGGLTTNVRLRVPVKSIWALSLFAHTPNAKTATRPPTHHERLFRSSAILTRQP